MPNKYARRNGMQRTRFMSSGSMMTTVPLIQKLKPVALPRDAGFGRRNRVFGGWY
jgi:hypothetical protein